jgi:hypothetical protein
MFRARRAFQLGLMTFAFLSGIADASSVAEAPEPGDSVATRPDPQGQATRVSVGIFVVDISEIDDAKQTFKADLYVTLRWKDRRLESSDVRRIVQLAKVWHPAVQIVNQRHLERELPQDVVKVDRDGNVVYEQRLEGTFVVPLNLHRFPLDEQVLAFRIVGPGHSSTDVEFVPDEHSGRAQNFSIMDWMIGSPASQTDPLATPSGRELAGFNCILTARRLTGAYIYQFVVPLTFIVCMSWAPFWMSPEQLGPRQGIAVTSILTVIAYRFVLASQLPRVAYLTRFDFLLLGCTTLVFLVLVQVVMAHAMLTKAQPERARKLDVWARGVFPALFLVLILGVFLL